MNIPTTIEIKQKRTWQRNPRLKLDGMTFGRLLVIKEVSVYCGASMWLCKCICGKEVIKKGALIKCGAIKSCGCLSIETTIKNSTKHGQSLNNNKTKEYNAWQAMKMRCYQVNSKGYCNYGGRGIKVCDSWLNSFQNFFEDMGKKPTIEHSLDRIDVNGDYELSNCRWATRKEQGQNLRKTIIIECKGIKGNLDFFSKMSNISTKLIYQRIYKHGWDAEDAVFLPRQNCKFNYEQYKLNKFGSAKNDINYK